MIENLLSNEEFVYLKMLVSNGFFSNDNEPLKCFKCNCSIIHEAITDLSFESYYNDEQSIYYCDNCNTILADYAYGFFYPRLK